MKYKRSKASWVYPFLVGVISFNILRTITDLTTKGVFWQGDKQTHIWELIFSILFCYIMDIVWRYRFNKSIKRRSVTMEYLLVFIELTILSNIYLSLGALAGIFQAGDLLNRFLIFISFVPLLMLYYTLIRNDIENKKYQDKLLQLEKIKANQAKTELEFLKSRYHPHFLFNALNTIYFQVDEENRKAKQGIEQLSELLRYQLYNIGEKVTMKEEINYLKSYIAFQQLRMSKRLVLTSYFDPRLKEQKIHPLLFQPLVENAFKHVRGNYKINIELRVLENKIRCTIENTLGETSAADTPRGKGIGIGNLRRRLDILYPGEYDLTTEQVNELFVAKLTIHTEGDGDKMYYNR